MSGLLAGRTALITGASRGIGAAVAKRFAQEGAQLILVARTMGALESMDDVIQQETGKSATLVPLDLKDMEKIDELGAAIYERFGGLDILVANAGILGSLSPIHHIKPKTWEEVFTVNVTANYRLIRSLDPLLRAAKQGRAMFVTTEVTETAHAYWGAYASSKAALEMMVKTYAAELAETSIKANLIEPGTVRTAMLSQAMPGIDLESCTMPDEITDIFVHLAHETLQENGKIFTPQDAVLP